MSDPSSGEPAVDGTAANRLDSWKEIAGYLKRDVTTVQRWEKREAMPVHRHVHDRLGSVYAFRSELDAWTRSRRPTSTAEDPESSGPAFPERSRVRLEGTTTGGSALRVGWIGVGLRMEMSTRDRRVTTSRVRSITIQSVPPLPSQSVPGSWM